MIIFVGDAPSTKNTSQDVAFVGTKSYKTLLSWIVEMELDVSKISLKNSHSLEDLAFIQHAVLNYGYKVVALGNKAEHRLSQHIRLFYTLPNPSGLNRQNNDKQFISKKLKECRRFLNVSNS